MSVIITYDSKHAIAVLMQNEYTFYIRIYGLEHNAKYMEFMLEGTRIKTKEV